MFRITLQMIEGSAWNGCPGAQETKQAIRRSIAEMEPQQEPARLFLVPKRKRARARGSRS